MTVASKKDGCVSTCVSWLVRYGIDHMFPRGHAGTYDPDRKLALSPAHRTHHDHHLNMPICQDLLDAGLKGIHVTLSSLSHTNLFM